MSYKYEISNKLIAELYKIKRDYICEEDKAVVDDVIAVLKKVAEERNESIVELKEKLESLKGQDACIIAYSHTRYYIAQVVDVKDTYVLMREEYEGDTIDYAVPFEEISEVRAKK